VISPGSEAVSRSLLWSVCRELELGFASVWRAARNLSLYGSRDLVI
jgi:hypothetical protein